MVSLSLIITSGVLGQDGSDNTIIVSGFVLDAQTEEGVTANIKIKNAATFSVIAVIPTTNLSGSYTFRLQKGTYYFIIETPGYEMYNVKVELSSVTAKRIQRNLILTPLGAQSNRSAIEIKQDETAVPDTGSGNSEEESFLNEINEGTQSSSATENLTSTDTPDTQGNSGGDEIEVEIASSNNGEETSSSGRRVVTRLRRQQGSSIQLETVEEVQPTAGTQVINDINQDRTSDINFKVKDGAQFLNLEMYFSNNDASTVNVTEQLDLVLLFLKQNPKYSLEIRGYAEEGLTSDENKQLAKQRAVNCRKYFMNNGITMDRVSAIAFPTDDLDIMIESRRTKRKQHLVEFRIKGDEESEKIYKSRYSSQYSQTSSASGINGSGSSSNSTDEGSGDYNNNQGSSSSSSDGIFTDMTGSGSMTESQGNITGTGTGTGTTSSNTSSAGTGNNSGSAADGSTVNYDGTEITGLVPDNNSVQGSGNIENSTGQDNGSTSSTSGEGSGEERKDLNSYNMGAEGANTQIDYDDKKYEFDEGTIDDDQMITALAKAQASADRIEKMVIKFESQLPSYDEVAYKRVTDSITHFLRNNRRYIVHIHGYMSKKGDKKGTTNLDVLRAREVRDFIIDQPFNIDDDRIKFHGEKYHPTKTEAGDKIPVDKQMIVTFKVEKMEVNVTESKTPPVGTGPRVRTGGTDIKPGTGGVKSVGHIEEKEEPKVPEFKTDQEYAEYLKNNQGNLKSVDGLFFRVQVGAYNLPVDNSNPIFKVDNVELLVGNDNYYRYVTDKYENINDAYKSLKKIKRKVDDAFVLAFYNDQKITMKEAVELIIKKGK